MSDEFMDAMKTLEGKTITKVEQTEVMYTGNIADVIKLTCSDKTQIMFGIDPDDVTSSYAGMMIFDESNSEPIVPWTCSYSKLRGEVYVYDATGTQVFAIPPEQIVHGVEYMDDEQLREWVRHDCSDILGDLNLI
jgi:hypothetical protein